MDCFHRTSVLNDSDGCRMGSYLAEAPTEQEDPNSPESVDTSGLLFATAISTISHIHYFLSLQELPKATIPRSKASGLLVLL